MRTPAENDFGQLKADILTLRAAILSKGCRSPVQCMCLRSKVGSPRLWTSRSCWTVGPQSCAWVSRSEIGKPRLQTPKLWVPRLYASKHRLLPLINRTAMHCILCNIAMHCILYNTILHSTAYCHVLYCAMLCSTGMLLSSSENSTKFIHGWPNVPKALTIQQRPL